MKKSLVLALCLMLALCATAFATNITENPAAQDFSESFTNVDVKFTLAQADVIDVDLAYGAMTFTYTNAWDSENHVYNAVITPSAAGTSNKFTVTNHSNVDLDLDYEFTQNAGFTGVTLDEVFTGDFKISEADEGDSYGDPEAAPTDDTLLTFNNLNNQAASVDNFINAANKVVGQVTVTITNAGSTVGTVYDAVQG